MIELENIQYVRLGTQDLEAAEHFATRVLGLEVAARERKAIYLKSDQRDHSLCYFEGAPSDQCTAFELHDEAALDEAAVFLEQQGRPARFGTADECDARRVKRFIEFFDPSGNKIELVCRPQISGRRYHGMRDAGISGFSHVGLYSSDPARDEIFWTTICNARVSDRIGDAPLLRIDKVHHTLAVLPGKKKLGIHHINHQVGSTDDVQRSNRFLAEQQIPIVFGPGRHPASSAQFLYFSGPDLVTFEYSVGVMHINDEPIYRERQLAPTPKGLCQWGAIPHFPA